MKVEEERKAHFIVFNDEGKILRTGTCQFSVLPFQAGVGEFVIEGEADDALHKIANGKVVQLTAKEIEEKKPAATYGQKRAAEYPSIEDQLDAIWKGGQEAEIMRQKVLAVKEKHPKDT